MVSNAWFAGGAMAHFLRLIFLLLVVLPLTVQANQPFTTIYLDRFDVSHSDINSACNASATSLGYTVPVVNCYINPDNPNVQDASIYADAKKGSVMQYGVGMGKRRWTCPTGETLLFNSNGTAKECTGTPPPACDAGYKSGVTGSKYFGSDGSTDCLNNCTYSIAVDMCISLTGGQGGCVGKYGNGTGASCSSPTNNKAPTPEADCMSQGKSFISVGGVTSCVAAGSQGSTPVTTKNNSSSSSNSSTKDANGNPTGSSSSNSTSNSSATFNGDGTVVVVTTTEKTNPDGTKETKTDTKTVSQTSYCAENPTAAQCKAATDSDISGACDAVACKGDAIQCAMAKEQARRNCEWFKENATAKALGEAMTNGTDTTPNPADSSSREHVNVQSSLDNSSPISASCFTDLTVTLMGQSATLPLSDWCPFFEALGYIFLALSYMAALRIVAGVIV